MAEVWLDEYKELYYEIRPNNRHIGAGDTNDRFKLKQDLHCKSFKWCTATDVWPSDGVQVPGERVPRPVHPRPGAVRGQGRHSVGCLTLRCSQRPAATRQPASASISAPITSTR